MSLGLSIIKNGSYYNHLRLGDKGIQVKKLQQRLSELNFYHSKLDGVFGRATVKAVMDFQQDKGLHVSGQINDKTWSEIFTTKGLNRFWQSKYPNFTMDELVNPLFDHCPASKWTELSSQIQRRLMNTLDIVQKIRTAFDVTIRINSTLRSKKLYKRWTGKSAHDQGKAIDFQVMNRDNKIYLEIMNWAKKNIHDLPEGTRFVLEWAGNQPWIHIDTHFAEKSGLYVMYPIGKRKKSGSFRMAFRNYEGKLPHEYL